MRTLKKIFIVAVVLVMTLTMAVKADTQVYRYTGNGTSGHTYNGVGVQKFNMTDGYVAFCVDINTNISTKQDYIKLSLENAETMGVLEQSDKVRAILNYSWNKTSKDELTAIQYALWHFMNGHSLPAVASNSVRTIYNKLLSDTETPPIPASQEVIGNTLTVTKPGSPVSAPTFQFGIETLLDTDLLIVITRNGQALTDGQYTLTEVGGLYTFTWLGDCEHDTEFAVTVTTLKNKSVNAWVFFAVDKKGNIDKNLSQTVAGLKPTESFISDSFKVKTHCPPTTTTTTTTTEPTTKETTTTTTEPTTEETTTPESSPTTPPEFPPTGESTSQYWLAVMFVGMAGVLVLVARKGRISHGR